MKTSKDYLILQISHEELSVLKLLLKMHIGQINESLKDVEKHTFPLESMQKTKDEVIKIWMKEKANAFELLNKIKQSEMA